MPASPLEGDSVLRANGEKNQTAVPNNQRRTSVCLGTVTAIKATLRNGPSHDTVPAASRAVGMRHFIPAWVLASTRPLLEMKYIIILPHAQ